MDNLEIDLYQAIKEMKRLTANKQFFSFSHATYSRDRQSSEGVRLVAKALLRPAGPVDNIQYADMMLFYTDEKNHPRHAWQCLIMTFNGKKVVLN